MTVDELDAMFVDGRSSGQGDFVPIDFEAVVKARTGRNKVTLQVLWGRYTASPAGAGQRYYSYERFRQLVAQHVNTAGVTARITHAPGHTMQVDWAGTKMRLFDPLGGQGGKLSVFVASLPYSGMLFAVACPNDMALQGRLDLTINIAAGVSSILSGILVTMIGYPLLAGLVFAIAFLAFVSVFSLKPPQIERADTPLTRT